MFGDLSLTLAVWVCGIEVEGEFMGDSVIWRNASSKSKRREQLVAVTKRTSGEAIIILITYAFNHSTRPPK